MDELPAAVPAFGFGSLSTDVRRCWAEQNGGQCWGAPVSDLGLCAYHLDEKREAS